jgi:transcription antitermination factor NusG
LGSRFKCDSEDIGVASTIGLCEPVVASTHAPFSGPGAQWYAVHTRPQHEKSVVAYLQRQGITTFLPLVSEIHRWSDRRKVVHLPLFTCYAFLHMKLVPESWSKVMGITGVIRFVGIRGQGVPIPDTQVYAVQSLLASGLSYQICPFLKVGQRVRVRGGALDGVEGILIARSGDRTLVISVEPIQRSLSIRIGEYHVEAI